MDKAHSFHFLATPHFLAKTDGKQVVPTEFETLTSEEESLDPVGDKNSFLAPFLLQKYKTRALILFSGKCLLHCRFCFRKNSFSKVEPSNEDLRHILKILTNKTDINEIILSGGDPVCADKKRIGRFIQDLQKIPHIKTLRIHSRVATAVNYSHSKKLLKPFLSYPFKIVFVAHVNHSDELDLDSLRTFKWLRKHGVTLLSQTVLLKEINNNFLTLNNLFNDLFSQGVIPYYLHQLDRTIGTSHYNVEIDEGKALVKTLRESLPGYLVPTYVQEKPGKLSKTPIL